MKKTLVKGENKKIIKLTPFSMLIVTRKYIVKDFSFITTIIFSVILCFLVYFFNLTIRIPLNLIFSGSITAISFSFAMMAAIKIVLNEKMLTFYANSKYSGVNYIYIFFAPFLKSLITWGAVAVISLITLSIRIKYSIGWMKNYLEAFLLSLVIYSILNLVQLMWEILRMTIEKSFSKIE